ncbi:MAG: hypothetical protein ACI9DG_001782 [Oleispira sp.]|jgi:hypothetical protein
MDTPLLDLEVSEDNKMPKKTARYPHSNPPLVNLCCAWKKMHYG